MGISNKKKDLLNTAVLRGFFGIPSAEIFAEFRNKNDEELLAILDDVKLKIRQEANDAKAKAELDLSLTED